MEGAHGKAEEVARLAILAIFSSLTCEEIMPSVLSLKTHIILLGALCYQSLTFQMHHDHEQMHPICSSLPLVYGDAVAAVTEALVLISTSIIGRSREKKPRPLDGDTEEDTHALLDGFVFLCVFLTHHGSDMTA